MVKKLFQLFSLTFLIGIAVFAWQGWAKSMKPEETPVLPEEAGIYEVPGKPELRMRVFVYKEKPETAVLRGKPRPSPTPEYVCGLTDPDSVAVVSATGWYLPNSFVYTLNPASAPSGLGISLSQIANEASSVWENALAGKVNLTENSVSTEKTRAGLDGTNIIAWGRTQGTALAVTYIWYNTLTGQATEVDTIMNKKYPWSWTPYDPYNLCAEANSYDAQDILTHELGHWFGLDDHYSSDYQENTMYGYGSKAEIKKDTLTTGDINGVNLVY